MNVPATSTVRLCSWNIRKLGHGDDKNYPAVARVIEDNCDIVGIVEMAQAGGTYPGYQPLMTALGDGWRGTVTETPRPNSTSSNSEYYAFVWRPQLLAYCDGWTGLRYHVDNDGSATGAGDDLFAREPAWTCFRVGSGFDFLVAAYHATYSEGVVSVISAEVAHIDEVFGALATSHPGERDIFLIGDFNLQPTTLAKATAYTDFTVGTGSTVNADGEITTNLYDHVVVYDPESTPELVEPALVLDVRNVVEEVASFQLTISDHLPVRLVLEQVGAGEDDD